MESISIANTLERAAEYANRWYTPTDEDRRRFEELRGVAALIRLAYAEGYVAGQEAAAHGR